jgi:hypothetical protein
MAYVATAKRWWDVRSPYRTPARPAEGNGCLQAWIRNGGALGWTILIVIWLAIHAVDLVDIVRRFHRP